MNEQHLSSQATDARRRSIIAAASSLAAPGMPLIYTGRLLAGLVINLAFVLIVLLFVIATTLLQFFPLFPGLVLIATWLFLCAMSASRAIRIIGTNAPRRRRAYQHPLTYTLIALLTFLAPLAITSHFTARHLLTVVPVEHPGMIPQTQPGDRLLIDRTVYESTPPRRGDLVALRVPGTDELTVLRVVGVPSDDIDMHGYTLSINEQLFDYTPWNAGESSAPPVVDEYGAELWIEHNHDQRYLISVVPGTRVTNAISNLVLDQGQFFVLADNRSHFDDSESFSLRSDSRNFGAISAEHIEGRPLYVAWSISPDSGVTQWERIGLPTK